MSADPAHGPAGDPGSDTDDGQDDGLGYAEAVAELESILAELERDDVDVDVLAPRVRRAAELVRWCRTRIGAARVDVEQIVADLDDLDTFDPGGTTQTT